MSSATNQGKITVLYQDATSRTYTLPDLRDEALTDIKSKVKAINQNMPENFSTTFISENKAPAIKIGKAQIISTEEEVIYSAN